MSKPFHLSLNEVVDLRFSEKVVVVTGAGYGIGESIALAFAREGAYLVLAGRNKERLENVSGAIRAMDRKSIVKVTDVSHEDQAEQMIAAAVEHFGRVDILVNNAGIEGPTRLVSDVDAEDWNQTISTNLTGAFYCAKHAVRDMLKRSEGCIVNIASVAGRIGYAYRTPYAASKWGLIGFSHSMAAELGSKGIRVNTVCPGPVEGERMNRVISNRAEATGIPIEKATRQALSGVPLHRMVTADEVAQAVLFLSTPEAAGITGQALNVDGGMNMH